MCYLVEAEGRLEWALLEHLVAECRDNHKNRHQLCVYNESCIYISMYTIQQLLMLLQCCLDSDLL